MKIATWNVNSVRARQDRLLRWLEAVQPDVVCLQEIKVTDEDFPYELVRQRGYRAIVYGQKTYNGVAILSRTEPGDVRCGLDDGAAEAEARLISAQIEAVRVISVYVPNGQSVGSPKYVYKLHWMRRLREYLQRQFDPSAWLVLGGDFNVARDDHDVARPAAWAGTVLCHQEVRQALQEIRAWGLSDVFRQHHPEGGLYSWWDYRLRAFARNDGLRIDHIFATEPMARRCTAAEIDRQQRSGQSPSDHAPVIAVFED
jgi:exodeoxyribonuclease-3